jgi:hypothetical protein
LESIASTSAGAGSAEEEEKVGDAEVKENGNQSADKPTASMPLESDWTGIGASGANVAPDVVHTEAKGSSTVHEEDGGGKVVDVIDINRHKSAGDTIISSEAPETNEAEGKASSDEHTANGSAADSKVVGSSAQNATTAAVEAEETKTVEEANKRKKKKKKKKKNNQNNTDAAAEVNMLSTTTPAAPANSGADQAEEKTVGDDAIENVESTAHATQSQPQGQSTAASAIPVDKAPQKIRYRDGPSFVLSKDVPVPENPPDPEWFKDAMVCNMTYKRCNMHVFAFIYLHTSFHAVYSRMLGQQHSKHILDNYRAGLC